MEVKIQTLTPLWTGGVDGKVDRIHETGILGSLRLWMEVLVRGVGGSACDPTEQKCSAKNGLCEVCKIFGAEGQKRRFRLEVVQDSIGSDKTVSSKIELQPYQYQYKDKEGKEHTGTRKPTWYFPKEDSDKPKVGTFSIQIQSLHPSFKPEVIGGLIQFIADWSALGARPQMGFGVIQVEGNRLDTQSLYDWLKKVEGEHKYPELPSLHNIFLAKIQPKESNPPFNEESTFNLKYDLRQLFRTQEESKTTEKKIQNQGGRKDLILKKDRKDNNVTESDGNKDLRHFIMGTVDNDRQAAKIKISRPYNENGTTVMRVWGWIPEESEFYKNGWDREKVVDAIYKTRLDWREMKSQRDTVKSNEDDVQTFLRSLLQLQEDN